MIDRIERLAAVLERPGLEPETTKLINAKLRDMLSKLDAALPAPEAGAGPLDPTTLDEWYNGPQPATRGGD